MEILYILSLNINGVFTENRLVSQLKTSFLPNFNNKTTSVAVDYTIYPNLITSLKWK